MTSCCGPDDPAIAVMDAGVTVRVVLVGNPNIGKSTLFNALTGARQKVGNWPGKTVEMATGIWRAVGQEGDVSLTDLPGTYSLTPGSPDEELTRHLLVTAKPAERPHVVVVVLDAANLARNLYLCAQLKDTGVPLVAALTMMDLAEQRGIRVDTGALAAELGVEVVPVAAREGRGTSELAAVVQRAHRRGSVPPPASLGEPVESAVGELLRTMPRHPDGRRPERRLALELLCGEQLPGVPGELTARAAELGERLVATSRDGAEDPDDDWDVETLLAERRYAWVHRVITATVRRGAQADRATRSDRIDQVLTSRLFGLPLFLAAMWAVFQMTTTLAAPLQDALYSFFDGPVTDLATTAVGDPDSNLLAGLVVHGIISGVGQLLSFAPLVIIMFVLLGLLEDSGYMARAAFLVDRLMRTIGLPGKAFLPIIVGFGCNVPALSAARILGDRRHRMLLGMVLPLVTCSARLTVYILIAGVFFGSNAGTVVFAMYLLSVLLLVGTGRLVRSLLFKGTRGDALILELPPYRLPAPRVVAAQVWQKLAGFLKTAGGIIVATVTAVWLLASVPLSSAASSFGQVDIEDSAFGGVARAVAPIFAPAGFDDWHTSAALVTGFVAKEAVVSTMAQTYGTSKPEDGRSTGTLGDQLRSTFDRTSGGHGAVAALAFMVFLLAYTPCMATVAAQRSAIGWGYTLWSMAMMLSMAWLLSVLVFQVGRLLV